MTNRQVLAPARGPQPHRLYGSDRQGVLNASGRYRPARLQLQTADSFVRIGSNDLDAALGRVGRDRHPLAIKGIGLMFRGHAHLLRSPDARR